MKILKMQKENKRKSEVTQDLVAHIGKSLYYQPDVKLVFIDVKFKDGTSLRFLRDEEDDDFEDCMFGN